MATSSQGYGQAVPGDASLTVTQAATGGSIVDRNCAIVRQLFDEVMNRRDLSRMEALLAPDLTVVHNALQTDEAGFPAYLRIFQTYVAAFPDLHLQVDDIFGVDDRVAVSMTITGTNQGHWMGHVATNKAVRFGAVSLLTVRGDSIVTIETISDTCAMLQQMGLMPDEETGRH